ncbi:MAG: hypothetical protein QY332_20790 [Anaerolineales bacterium]|nr:MAG: hypothetical protein QY332_20790 [Anaerolineales bacterium]
MDALIYSASPLKTFSGSLFMIVFSVLLGLVTLVPSFFARREQPIKRIATGCIGFILLLVGVGVSVSAYNTYHNGDKTVLVQALEKNEITTKCNKSYCTDYVVETSDGERNYVFGLSKETWDRIEINACYQFTYFPLKPLLGEYLQEESEYPSLYEPTGDIRLIERVHCST